MWICKVFSMLSNACAVIQLHSRCYLWFGESIENGFLALTVTFYVIRCFALIHG